MRRFRRGDIPAVILAIALAAFFLFGFRLRANQIGAMMVVPRTKATEALAKRMAERAAGAGVTIALVDGRGAVRTIDAGHR